MSYIDLINAFERWLETNYLPISSQLLWYKLISLFNRCGWSEWVTVDNQRLMSIMQIKNEKTFIKCRDSLIEAGLFEYKKGKKGSPNQYKINTVNFTVHSTVQTTVNNTVKSTVNVTDINRLDKDIYINLLNKYARQNRVDFSEYVKTVSKMKQDPDWEKLNWEEQQKIISEI
jgi:hypothetical protein